MSEFLDNSEFIFKYVPFNIYTLKLLIEGKIWFGAPKSLNDPYEGEFIIENMGEIPEDKINEIKIILNPTVNPSWFNEIYNPNNGKVFNREYSDYMKDSLKELYGIASFSKEYRNLLMWTHYSDSHKGMCLVFNSNELEEYFKDNYNEIICKYADYKLDIPKIKLEFTNIGIPIFDGHEIFSFKFIDFKMENEVRYIKYFDPKENENRALLFDRAAIKAVIFGENMPVSDRKTIAHILKNINIYEKVKFFQSTKNIKNRNMRVEPLNGKAFVDVFEDFGVHWSLYGDIVTPKDFIY